MQPTEQESFGARLAILAEVFAEPMSPTRLEGYVALLDEYPLADLVPALEVCAKHCTYFPRPVDITDAVASVRYEREQQRTQRLLAAYVEPPRGAITEAQWQARWAGLKRIAQAVPMKPHRGLDGKPCGVCADCRREARQGAGR